jgi:hypothetical protein
MARRTSTRWLVSLALVTAALHGCSRREPPPPPRTEPWPATPPAAERPTARHTFELGPGGSARFEVPGREARWTGELRVARGQLAVDLMRLQGTQGTVEFDLASARVLGSDGTEDRQASAEAQSWFDVGPSRPEALRERLRWARFTLRNVRNPSAVAAHEGRVVRRGTLPPLGGADEPSARGGAAGMDTREIREVTADAEGQLLLHGYQVDVGVRLRIAFEYAVPATAGAVPERLRIETVRAFPVSLAAHDIVPRSGSGGPVNGTQPLLGKHPGREARVSVQLLAAPTAS